MPKNIGVVILAAGSSSRLGRPKQLVEFQNKTLLQHVIDTVDPFNFTTAVLILGAHANQIREAINLKNVTVLNNEAWSEGIASSIRLGVQKSIESNESLESIMFLLSDQPFVTTKLIDKLVDKHKNGRKLITACRYDNIVGVPVIFNKNFFPGLTELTGDSGAKKIILQNRNEVQEVPFRKGDFDIDTPEDFEKLQDNMN